MITLGVPTLCRYDLLDRMLASALAGSLRPARIVVVDNGGGLERSRLPAGVELVSPGENIGVAKSWNTILELAGGDAVLANDDIVFHRDTLEGLVQGIGQRPFANAGSWSLFYQRLELIERIGWYDAHYWPAYYEDADYAYRMRVAGIEPHQVRVPLTHEGSASLRSPHGPAIRAHAESNRLYYQRKWGGFPGGEAWKVPFGGNPPLNWHELKMHRWDAVNIICDRLEADNYLEIGLSDGQTMRRVRAKRKWGVDPAHQPDGIQHAHYFSQTTSDEFFSRCQEAFDVVFIDGWHEAVQAYRDVQNAIAHLTPRGAILLHDCNPHTEAMQRVPPVQGEWTGDVWRTIARIRSEGEHTARVVADDYGIGVVIPRRPEPPIVLGKPWTELGWADLSLRRVELLGLIGSHDYHPFLDEALARRS